ncbi:MAG: hypothetical protein ACRDDY_05410 [Clostridium sp.]|uniref:hypothetical protein n=1 Tax=Clostridium sp. TaxID=1506 RepID=UPI003EE81252
MNFELYAIAVVLGIIMIAAVATARTRYLKAETYADFVTAWYSAEELVKSGIRKPVIYNKAVNYVTAIDIHEMHIGENVIKFHYNTHFGKVYAEAVYKILFHNSSLRCKRKIDITINMVYSGKTTEVVACDDVLGVAEVNVNIELMPPTALANLLSYVI